MRKAVKTIMVLAAAALFLLTGCSKASKSLFDFKPGMAKSDVISVLGNDYTESNQRILYYNIRLLDFADTTRSSKAVFYVNDADEVYAVGYYVYDSVESDYEKALAILNEKYGTGEMVDTSIIEWTYDSGNISLTKGSDYVAIGIY